MGQKTLFLNEEHKLKILLGTKKKLEASGVVMVGENYYVVCDNFSKVAKINKTLSSGKQSCSWVNKGGGKEGFEDISYNPSSQTFFTVVEAVRRKNSKKYFPQIHEFDAGFREINKRWVEIPFNKRNKGLEGLEHVTRKGKDYLLGLCEGNFCEGKGKNQQGGGGRIHVLERSKKNWERVATIHLPKSLKFKDYASVTLDGHRIAIVSQENAELWVGTLHAQKWIVVGRGKTYAFPKKNQKIVYGNVEGVCWIGKNKLVVVSDKKKLTQPQRVKSKDQSIHIFTLPT